MGAQESERGGGGDGGVGWIIQRFFAFTHRLHDVWQLCRRKMQCWLAPALFRQSAGKVKDTGCEAHWMCECSITCHYMGLVRASFGISDVCYPIADI